VHGWEFLLLLAYILAVIITKRLHGLSLERETDIRKTVVGAGDKDVEDQYLFLSLHLYLFLCSSEQKSGIHDENIEPKRDNATCNWRIWEG
jgi:hypothetical protein